MSTVKQSRFGGKSLSRLGLVTRKMETSWQCFGNTRSNAPKATERTQAMLSVLPVVLVSEHFMLKERLRKWQTLTRTHLCVITPKKKNLHDGLQHHSNTYPSSFPSFKQGHWVALVKLCFKESGKYHLQKACHLPSAAPRERC